MPTQSKQVATRIVVAIVLLRLVIGFHFFSEGRSKLGDGNFSSAGFLGNAHGPLAGWYKGRVWDADGRHRLCFARLPGGDVDTDMKPTLEAWEEFKSRVVSRHELDEKQQASASTVVERYQGQLEWFLAANRDDILAYFHQLDRREKQQSSPALREVSSLREQGDKLAADIRKARGPLLAGIETIWEGLERDLNRLGPEQSSADRLILQRPGRRGLDSVAIDTIIPVFDILIGVFLIIGLLIPVAAGAGALFLFSVILSQWPGSFGATPVFYQSIEMFSLVLLALASAGRYAGMDYFLFSLYTRWRERETPATATQGNSE